MWFEGDGLGTVAQAWGFDAKKVHFVDSILKSPLHASNSIGGDRVFGAAIDTEGIVEGVPTNTIAAHDARFRVERENDIDLPIVVVGSGAAEPGTSTG
jgi:hypothetical protein